MPELISSSDKRILLELFKKRKSINIYYLHKKYLLSPAQINRFVRNYLEEKLISFDNCKIKLTEKGIEWILHNRKKIFLSHNKNKWKIIPNEWIVNLNDNVDNLKFRNKYIK